jgi:murein DD-endopeptidase MepM/ murein hydrolase activator NlpD
LALLGGTYQVRARLQNRNQEEVDVRATAQERTAERRASCSIRDLRLRLPIRGTPGHDWELANFFDTDPITGRTKDYMGAVENNAITYDGHSGIDFELPSFRVMDQGIDVLASADGVVEETFDQNFDRNRTCVSEKWNYVKIRHANGFATIYAHLRKNSLAVKVGERVSTGMRLGQVGSSGCSSYPHIHLEVLDCQNQALDVMPEKIFDEPIVYPTELPAAAMETFVFQPIIHELGSIQDPTQADVRQVVMNVPFSIALTISNLHAGEILRFEFVTPQNSVAPFSYEQRIDKFYTRSHWWSNFTFAEPGTWIVRVTVNGRVIAERSILATDNGQ